MRRIYPDKRYPCDVQKSGISGRNPQFHNQDSIGKIIRSFEKGFLPIKKKKNTSQCLIESNTKSLGRSLAIRSRGSRVRSQQLSQLLLMEQRSKRTSSGEGQTLKRGWPKRAGEINQDWEGKMVDETKAL